MKKSNNGYFKKITVTILLISFITLTAIFLLLSKQRPNKKDFVIITFSEVIAGQHTKPEEAPKIAKEIQKVDYGIIFDGNFLAPISSNVNNYFVVQHYYFCDRTKQKISKHNFTSEILNKIKTIPNNSKIELSSFCCSRSSTEYGDKMIGKLLKEKNCQIIDRTICSCGYFKRKINGNEN